MVHGLISPNTIIVIVDFTERLHHFELVFVSFECRCIGAHGWAEDDSAMSDLESVRDYGKG